MNKVGEYYTYTFLINDYFFKIFVKIIYYINIIIYMLSWIKYQKRVKLIQLVYDNGNSKILLYKYL